MTTQTQTPKAAAEPIPSFLLRAGQDGKIAGVHVKKFGAGVAKGAYKSTSEAKAKTGATSKPTPLPEIDAQMNKADKVAAQKLSTLQGRKSKALLAETPKPAPKPEKVAKIAIAKKAPAKKAHKATAEEFTVGKMVYRGKNALLLKLVSRKDGKIKGATMKELLKATGWAACSSTLGKLCRQSGLKLQRDGEGEARRFWVS